jgi:hypothetical protein
MDFMEVLLVFNNIKYKLLIFYNKLLNKIWGKFTRNGTFWSDDFSRKKGP